MSKYLKLTMFYIADLQRINNRSRIIEIQFLQLRALLQQHSYSRSNQTRIQVQLECRFHISKSVSA